MKKIIRKNKNKNWHNTYSRGLAINTQKFFLLLKPMNREEYEKMYPEVSSYGW